MDNNQYFFSNEKGSNSNFNMIGGAEPLTAPKSAEKQQKMLNAAGAKAAKGDPLSPIEGMRLKRDFTKAKGGPSKGAPGGKGGSGGTGAGTGGNNQTVSKTAENVANMPTTGNNKPKIQKDLSAKDKKCKSENKKINNLTEKNKHLELEIDGLTEHLNKLSNILAVYEKQFTDFSEQKKIFDKTITDMKEILFTEEAQKYVDEFKAMLDRRPKQANNNKGTEEKECDCSEQSLQQIAAPPPPESETPKTVLGSDQPQPVPEKKKKEKKTTPSNPEPSKPNPEPGPPQPNPEPGLPQPNSKPAPSQPNSDEDVDSLGEEEEGEIPKVGVDKKCVDNTNCEEGLSCSGKKNNKKCKKKKRQPCKSKIIGSECEEGTSCRKYMDKRTKTNVLQCLPKEKQKFEPCDNKKQKCDKGLECEHSICQDAEQTENTPPESAQVKTEEQAEPEKSEKAKTKKKDGEDCENNEDCEDDFECKDKKCKEKKSDSKKDQLQDEDSLGDESDGDSLHGEEEGQQITTPPEDEDNKKTGNTKSYEGDSCNPGGDNCGENLNSGLECRSGKCMPEICGITKKNEEVAGRVTNCGDERECSKTQNEKYFTCKEKEGKTKSKRDIGEQCHKKAQCKDNLMCDKTGFFYPTCQNKKKVGDACKTKFVGSECEDHLKCDKEKKICIQKGGSRNKTRRRRARRQKGSGRKKTKRRSKTN